MPPVCISPSMGCTHPPLGTTAMSMQVLTFVCNIPSQLLQPMFLSEIKIATEIYLPMSKRGSSLLSVRANMVSDDNGKKPLLSTGSEGRRGGLAAAGCCLGAEYSCVALVAPLHPAPPSCSRCSASSSTVSLAGRPGPVVQRLSTAAPPSPWSCG